MDLESLWIANWIARAFFLSQFQPCFLFSRIIFFPMRRFVLECERERENGTHGGADLH